MLHRNIRKCFYLLLLLPIQAFTQNTPAEKLEALFRFSNNRVLVAAHRGDWRNAPENSVQSTRNSIDKGFDIVELDLKESKDSILFLLHDKTLNRSTTGKGEAQNLDWAELQALRLRSGTGHPTLHAIPSFREILACAKNKVILDIDKGYDYFHPVVKLLRETGMVDQCIINLKDNTTLQEIEKEQNTTIPEDLTIMEVVNMERPDADRIIMSYRTHKRTIIQCIFSSDTLPSLKKLPFYRTINPLWMNGLWPEQNGGHDDDRAVERADIDQSWQWLINKGASIIQTDRPLELKHYLEQRPTLGS